YRSDRTGFYLGRLLTPLFPILGLGIFLAWRFHQGFPGLQGLLDLNWGRIHVWPWQVIWEALTAGIFHSSIIRWLNLGLLVFGIFTTVDSIRRREIGFAIYLTSSLIFILSSSVIGEPLCGLGRYLLTVFPGFIYLGRWMQPGWRAKIIIAVSSFPHYYLCICFFLGMFIG
ncbi:MAG TPA: hypothetical protein VHO48_13575, partial [Anaerolineaceae bacterium]|nr:hypothetical protein [Anaerolineaceae bacterium]